MEFDKTIPSTDDIAREYVAFANSDGGHLILGIDDKNKHLMGVDLADDSVDKLMKIGSEKCVPAITPHIETMEKNGKKVIDIMINEGDEKPYRTDDLLYKGRQHLASGKGKRRRRDKEPVGGERPEQAAKKGAAVHNRTRIHYQQGIQGSFQRLS